MIEIKNRYSTTIDKLGIGDTFTDKNESHYIKIIEVVRVADECKLKYNAVLLETGALEYFESDEMIHQCDYVLNVKE